MVVPLVVLAVGATLVGFIGLPGGLLDHPDWNLLGARARAGARAPSWRSRTAPRSAFMVGVDAAGG